MSIPPSAASLPSHSIRWFHATILAVLLATGGFFRFYHLGNLSLWVDEYWSIYLSTGRAQPATAVFDAPLGVVLNPPPAVSLSGAPPWWRIWTGMSSAVHPPLYHIVLRWWMDLFGDSDAVTRCLSGILGLGATLLLFDCLRLQRGPWTGILAAALMLFSCVQLDLSRETRSYMLLVFLGLVCCRIILSIERRGPSRSRLIALGVSAAIMALTHYFSAGFLAGLGVYAIVQFSGRARILVLATLIAAGIFVALCWGPFLWSTRALLVNLGDYPAHGPLGFILYRLFVLPTRMILSPKPELIPWLAMVPLAALAYILPAFSLRKTPELRLWYFCALGAIGFVLAFDLARQTVMISIPRLLLASSPCIFALVAMQMTSFGSGSRFRAPLLIFVCGGLVWTLLDWFHLDQVLMIDRVTIIVVALAIVTYFVRPRSRWPLWVAWSVGMAIMLQKYILLARSSGGLPWLMIFAALLFLGFTVPRRQACKWLGPLAGASLAIWAAVFAIEFTEGGSVPNVKPDWRLAARVIDQLAGPNDLVVFTPCQESFPSFCYIVYRHYAPDSDRLVMFLENDPPSPASLAALAQRQRVWVVGLDPGGDTARLFPGWKRGAGTLVPGNCIVWPIYPPAAADLR